MQLKYLVLASHKRRLFYGETVSKILKYRP